MNPARREILAALFQYGHDAHYHFATNIEFGSQRLNEPLVMYHSDDEEEYLSEDEGPWNTFTNIDELVAHNPTFLEQFLDHIVGVIS